MKLTQTVLVRNIVWFMFTGAYPVVARHVTVRYNDEIMAICSGTDTAWLTPSKI